MLLLGQDGGYQREASAGVERTGGGEGVGGRPPSQWECQSSSREQSARPAGRLGYLQTSARRKTYEA